MSSVVNDLEKWGPDESFEPVCLKDALTYTWDLATSHYENFPVVSLAVPKHLRQHFANIYAFCRWADDLGDETGSREQAMRLLEWWQSELEKCYGGEAKHPVYVALTETIGQFSLPIKPFKDLISAFVQDQQVSEYQTFEQLENYCQRSANPVGQLVLYLGRCASESNLRHSDFICTGLQLTNFWQDVGRDKKIGRIYLPEQDRLQFGYSQNDFENEIANDAFRQLMNFEVDRARSYLLEGKPLVYQMSGRLQLNMDLILNGGLQILQSIEAIQYNVWEKRPVLSKAKLLSGVFASLFRILYVNSMRRII